MKNLILRLTNYTNQFKNNNLYKILHKIARYIGIVKLFHRYRGNLNEVRFKMNILGAKVTMIDRTPHFYYYYIYLDDKAYEPALTKKINSLVNSFENPVFADIGAHLGYYSLLVSNWKEGSNPVYAFEPNPVFFKTFQENISINRLKDKIKPFQIALSNKEGKARMTGWDSRIMDEDENGAINTITFDSFCEKEGVTPDIIKIDVHGAEGKILAGMHNILSRTFHVFCETHNEMMGFSVSDIVQMMKSAGLNVYEFTNHRKIDGGNIIPLTDAVLSEHKDRIIYGVREK